MKYENKKNALGLIRIIEQQEEIIKRAKSVKNNLNHYSISICIADSSCKSYISLDDLQSEDFLNRVINDANKQMENYKQEFEKL